MWTVLTGFLVDKVQGPYDILKCVAGQQARDIHAVVFLEKLDGRKGRRAKDAIGRARRVLELLERILGLAHFRRLHHKALAIGAPVAQPSLFQAAVKSERMIFSVVMPSGDVFVA